MDRAQPEIFGMTDLEDRLWAEDGQEVRRAVVARLDALLGRVSAEIDAGLTPSQYASADLIRIALATARDVMLMRL